VLSSKHVDRRGHQTQTRGYHRQVTRTERVLCFGYPTVGPNGTLRTNINGSACGTSLYLGTAAIAGEDGELTPVLCGGYEEKVKRYQSELVDKNLVQERFLKSLEGSQLPDEANLAPMRAILPMMFTAFAWLVY